MIIVKLFIETGPHWWHSAWTVRNPQTEVDEDINIISGQVKQVNKILHPQETKQTVYKGNGYFSSLWMTITKCIILDYYVAL